MNQDISVEKPSTRLIDTLPVSIQEVHQKMKIASSRYDAIKRRFGIIGALIGAISGISISYWYISTSGRNVDSFAGLLFVLYGFVFALLGYAMPMIVFSIKSKKVFTRILFDTKIDLDLYAEYHAYESQAKRAYPRDLIASGIFEVDNDDFRNHIKANMVALAKQVLLMEEKGSDDWVKRIEFQLEGKACDRYTELYAVYFDAAKKELQADAGTMERASALPNPVFGVHEVG